ncbi:MAG: AmmeMemoRadiSam system protein A [Saprospiraceae bacterium]|nr:AmmeMemoRadiSam system protein A [Saprospiraceae bacterium]
MEEIDGKILLKIARNAILEEFDNNYKVIKEDFIKISPALINPRATFVTLSKESGTEINELRGCIGSIFPHRKLIDDIIHNAKSAAFHDPRFNPVNKSELEEIIIEISILSEPEKIQFENTGDLKSIIIPYKHGVIIRKSYNRAVFLPDVWKKLPHFDIFFSHLCRKAGLNSNCIDTLDEIELFEVEKFSEDERS